MGNRAGEIYLIDGTDEVEVHRGVQDLWRAQNAAWRARALSELRPPSTEAEMVEPMPFTGVRRTAG